MARTEAQKIATTTELAHSYAKTPTWALWLLTVVGICFTVTPAFVVGFICYGYVVACLAARKGRVKLTWWSLYGAFIFPVAAIQALVMKPTPEAERAKRTSAWATLPTETIYCGYVDELAPGPCVKQKGHHVRGLDRSPHDYRETAKGTP